MIRTDGRQQAAPAALSLITTAFAEGPQRNRALGVYSLAGATGYTAGLIASGLLTEISWRPMFFLPVPVTLLVLAAAPLVLPRGVRPAGAREGFDAAGAVAVTGGVLPLVFALAERSWPAGAVAVLLLGAFVTIERRRSFPSLNIAAVAGLPDERQGLASGLRSRRPVPVTTA
ncbi:hypothetical protein ACIHFD_51350 [Nonomuraea sp. NPDC051941]|uniref:hypothetical protein n=1 Tax=Nonomuraea sp. NPDC051941 TaxID=3364373 RepID=UPI0037C812C4